MSIVYDSDLCVRDTLLQTVVNFWFTFLLYDRHYDDSKVMEHKK